MKTIQKLFLVIMVSMSLMAYSQETKQNDDNAKKSSKSFGKGASVVEKIRALNKEKNALKTLNPLTIKELQDWLPDNIKGMHKTESTALTQSGITGVNAEFLEEHPEYGKDYGKNLSILIIDGHGERGAAAVGPYVSVTYGNINTEKSNGYTKTVMYEDTAVKEEFNSNNNTYTLSFFYNNRFGVEIKLKGFKQNELWEVFKEFNLQSLNN